MTTDLSTFKLYILFNTAALIAAILVGVIVIGQTLNLQQNQQALLDSLNNTKYNVILNTNQLKYDQSQLQLLKEIDSTLDNITSKHLNLFSSK